MQKKRILVIDDDIRATRMLKLGLEGTGEYEVRELNHSARALSVARDFRPDAVLLDVCMPEVEGSAVAFALQNESGLGSLSIIFLTCIVSEREVAERGSLIGGHRYIAKPTRLEKVIDCLEQELEIHQTRKPRAPRSPGVFVDRP
jgi:two-component system OmpR family response regulator